MFRGSYVVLFLLFVRLSIRLPISSFCLSSNLIIAAASRRVTSRRVFDDLILKLPRGDMSATTPNNKVIIDIIS